jgi:hypothetical protein
METLSVQSAISAGKVHLLLDSTKPADRALLGPSLNFTSSNWCGLTETVNAKGSLRLPDDYWDDRPVGTVDQMRRDRRWRPADPTNRGPFMEAVHWRLTRGNWP